MLVENKVRAYAATLLLGALLKAAYLLKSAIANGFGEENRLILASGSHDETIKLWDVNTGRVPKNTKSRKALRGHERYWRYRCNRGDYCHAESF